jgi:hypothetical protein
MLQVYAKRLLLRNAEPLMGGRSLLGKRLKKATRVLVRGRLQKFCPQNSDSELLDENPGNLDFEALSVWTFTRRWAMRIKDIATEMSMSSLEN